MKLRKRSWSVWAASVIAVFLSACSGGSVTLTPPGGARSAALTPSPGSIALTAVGQTQVLTVANGSGVTAASSNGAIATVAAGSSASSFVVTAVAGGSATITLRAAGFTSASVPVTVTVTNVSGQ